MSDFQISGVDDFLKLSKALKHAGHGELRKELNRRLKEAVKPLTPETRARALETLPKRGGLAARVAKAPQRVAVKTGRDAGVALVVGKRAGSGARSANTGSVRHPVFGDRKTFVEQKVPADWFDGPARKAKPEVTKAVEQAMQSIVDDIVRGV